MSENVREFEPYIRTNYVKCPNCGKETKIVERTTDFTSYVIDCRRCGRVELTYLEEEKAKREYNEDRKAELASVLASTPLLRKRRPTKNRKIARNLKSTKQQEKQDWRAKNE